MSWLQWLVPIVIISIWMIFYFIVCGMIAFGTGGRPRNILQTMNNEPNVYNCFSCDLRYTHPDPKNILEYAIHHTNFHKIENNEQAALQDFLFPLEEEKK